MSSILIIEDDEELAPLIGQALKEGGHSSQVALDGVQAMALVRQMHPALIILDFLFPAGGGAAFHQRLRLSQHTRDIPVLILSSVAEEKVLKSVDMDGRTYYLAKPYKKDELLAMVGQILGSGLDF